MVLVTFVENIQGWLPVDDMVVPRAGGLIDYRVFRVMGSYLAGKLG